MRIGKLLVEKKFMADAPVVVPVAEPVADSEATTIAALKTDFNGLLASLRTAGLLAPTPEPEPDPEPSES